jgi:N-acetylneuraminic acid mutarotase
LFSLLLTIGSVATTAPWQQLPPLPEALGVAAPFAGTSGGVLLVAGGANFPAGMPWEGGKKVWHDRVWSLEQPAGAWREVGRLPRARAYGVSVTFGDALICLGGSDAERHHADAFALRQAGALVQEPLPPLPIPLANAAGAVDANGTVYVAAGSSEPGESAASARVFAADFRVRPPAWRELPPLPGGARILPVAAAHGDAFFLFGGAALQPQPDGKTARTYLRDAWRYTAQEGWRRLADLPHPVAAAASPAPVAGGRIFLISGDDGSRAGFQPMEKHPGFPADILAYDLAANTWHPAGAAPAPRATLPVAAWQGRFILPSGEVRPGVRSPEVWSFLPPP